MQTTARALVAALVALCMAAVPLAASASTDVATLPSVAPAVKALTTVPSVADPDVGRLAIPEDRYAMTLGCYELTNVASGASLGRAGAGYGATAAPFHFEPTALGTYLLLDPAGDLLSAAKGAAEQADDVVQDVEYHSPIARDTHLTRSFDDDVPAPLADHTIAGNAPAVDTHTGAVVPGEAGPSADWRARRNLDGTFTFTLDAASGRALAVVGGTPVLTDLTAGDAARFRLRSVDEAGCAVWPEIDPGVEGPVLAGATPWDETRGTIDAHLHLMAFEFLGGDLRCGRPWHPYGVTEALGDCTNNSMTGYSLSESVAGRGPGNGNDTMWPDFTVPQSNTLTYEQVYYRWLERAWRSGLRMMTVLLVDNNVLCEAYPYKRNSCNEMDAVRLQARRVHEFVDYLDARAGGPGEGFAQIVTDPFEAREVVNAGKLAFVLGIEVSVLFDCGEYQGVSRCTNADISRQLDEIQDLGIVQMELVNKFDNALSGVTGDGGTTGIIVNQGNKYETGHYWKMETCPEERAFGTDKRQENLVNMADGTPFEPIARDPLAAAIFRLTGTTAQAPVYPAGPHCNTIGLTDQGVFTLQEMAARGLLFDPDHMSARAATAGMDVMEELGYSGIVSSHSWANDTIYERVYELGGMVTPYAGGSSGFVNAWRQRLGWADDRYYFGFGYGADTNGLGGQGGARRPNEDNDVDYPFTVPGGAVVSQLVSGNRTFDINTDGVAQYGLYADWMEDLRVQAGDEIIEDMLRGPEAYLQTWERAVGVPKDVCVFGDGTVDPTDGLTPGMTVEQVLRTAGQPSLRTAEGYTYCGLAADGSPTDVLVEFAGGGVVGGIEESTVSAAAPISLNPVRTEAAALATDEVRPDLPVHDDHAGESTSDAHLHADGVEHLHTAGAITTAPAGATTPGGVLPVLALALLFMGVIAPRVRPVAKD